MHVWIDSEFSEVAAAVILLKLQSIAFIKIAASHHDSTNFMANQKTLHIQVQQHFVIFAHECFNGLN
jgi:hypothetical protein